MRSGDLGLAAKERDVRQILGRARAALPAETIAGGDLTTLHARARKAVQRVPPGGRPVRPQPLRLAFAPAG
jgi:hypothetical protein